MNKINILKFKKVLAIFAHPDDESFACAGYLRKLVNSGATVNLICATKGEKGSAGISPLCSRKELGKFRSAELKKAGKIIGIKKIFFLGLLDGSLNKISLKTLTSYIFPILKKYKPNLIITFIKSGISGHPDHIQISKAVTSSFKKYQTIYPETELYYCAIPDKLMEKGKIKNNHYQRKKNKIENIDIVVNIKQELKVKIKAIKCHKTQEKDWQKFFDLLQFQNLHYEYYVRFKK